MKKKKIVLIVLAAIIVSVSLLAWYVQPKKIDQTLEGIVYRLGEKDSPMEENVTVTLKGSFYRKLFRDDHFKGTIDIKGGGHSFIPLDNYEVEISYWAEYHGQLMVREREEAWYLDSYGTIYHNQDFSEMTIAILEPGEEENQSSWNGEDGLMISAPATNRKEALELSNQLMKDMLMQPLK